MPEVSPKMDWRRVGYTEQQDYDMNNGWINTWEDYIQGTEQKSNDFLKEL